MKTLKIVLLIVSVPLIFILGCQEQSLSLSVISYNIRYDSPHDGDNVWENRKQGLTNLLKDQNPDIIGTQEGQSHQLDYLKSQLTTYKMIGVDRDANGKSEYSSVFFNSKTLKLLNTNTFWLSETPDIPSLGWDASFKRICTYGLFESKNTKDQFYAFNTHFDHMSEKSRLESAVLINKKINEINIKNLPVVLMGDFNCQPNSKPITTITKQLVDGKKSNFEGPLGTFSGFDRNAELQKRIDYIFVKNFKVNSYSHINHKLSNGNWPSDHIPVQATLFK